LKPKSIPSSLRQNASRFVRCDDCHFGCGCAIRLHG